MFKANYPSESILSKVLSSSFSKRLTDALIHDHEYYKSSTSTNSWSASVREVLNCLYAVRSYYATYIVSNSRAKRASTHTKAWHIDLLYLYLNVCLLNDSPILHVLQDMKEAFEFDSHSSDRR